MLFHGRCLFGRFWTQIRNFRWHVLHLRVVTLDILSICALFQWLLCPRPSLVKAKTRRCRASHVTSATFSLVHKKMFQRNSTSTFSLLVERRRHSFLAPIEISSVIMRAHRAVRAAVSSEIAASLSGRSCASRPRFLCLNAPAARRKETRCFSQGRVLRAGAAEAV